jgi:uncharacterized protein (TIGR02246 family)
MGGFQLVKFTTEQALAYVTIQELIHEWSRDLDQHNGARIADFLTDDCVYAVTDPPRQGPAEVAGFYSDRLARLSAEPGGAPIHRHMLTNFCVRFRGADEAAVEFSLTYLTAAYSGTRPDLAVMADVKMTVRRSADGDWRIARFESHRPFHRN